jgi:hypothetical protein
VIPLVFRAKSLFTRQSLDRDSHRAHCILSGRRLSLSLDRRTFLAAPSPWSRSVGDLRQVASATISLFFRIRVHLQPFFSIEESAPFALLESANVRIARWGALALRDLCGGQPFGCAHLLFPTCSTSPRESEGSGFPGCVAKTTCCSL